MSSAGSLTPTHTGERTCCCWVHIPVGELLGSAAVGRGAGMTLRVEIKGVVGLSGSWTFPQSVGICPCNKAASWLGV